MVALAEADRLDVYDLLGITVDTTYLSALGLGVYTLESKLQNLTAAEVIAVQGVLEAFRPIMFDTGVLSGEYSDNPANKRMRMKMRLARILGVELPNPLEIGRV